MNTYVIYDKLSCLCKIGKTKNLKSRIATLGTANLNLELLVAIPYDMEKELHTLFKDKKVNKEWYKLDEFDVNGILEINLEKFKQELNYEHSGLD